jgi:hypothetical protein
MEVNFWFIGIGISISVLGFFLKRLKEEISINTQKISGIEKSIVELKTKISVVEKLCEDRRQDIKSLYEKINK